MLASVCIYLHITNKTYYFALCIWSKIIIKQFRSKASDFHLLLVSWNEAGTANRHKMISQIPYLSKCPMPAILCREKHQSLTFIRVTAPQLNLKEATLGSSCKQHHPEEPIRGSLLSGDTSNPCAQDISQNYNLILLLSHSETGSQSYSVHKPLYMLSDS